MDAGWHFDPLGTHQWRWHDGEGWTDHTSDIPDAPPSSPSSAADARGSLPPTPPVAPGDASAAMSSVPPPAPPGAGTPPPPDAGTSSRRRTGLIVAAVIAVAVVAGVVMFGMAGASNTIDGTFTLADSSGFSNTGTGCVGDGGYSDIRPGTAVTVRDGSGTILGTSSLGPGEELVVWCQFEFTVAGIPKADFYEIEVGRRGSLSYSYDEMARNDWNVSFSLGE